MLGSARHTGGRTDGRGETGAELAGVDGRHTNRYLKSGGTDGHLYKMTQPGRPEITVPSLLLTTTGRKSGEKFIFPLFYGDVEGGSYLVIASKGGAPKHRTGT